VLHAGPGDRVALLDLGDAEAIDRLVARFKMRIASSNAPDRQDALMDSRELHAKIFVPLQRELGVVKEIFIAPDGNLNLLPFEVLQGPDGKFLIEDYTFYYLGSGRDLLGFGTSQRPGGKALLLGDPNFDLGPEEKASTLRQLALAAGTDDAGVKRSTDLRGFQFARLPGTRQEVRAIHALLGADKADLFTDKAALEEVLRQKGTPRILHLATHGFFLSDQDLASLRDDDRGMRQSWLGAAPPAKAGKIENPLVRSGIALAGANRALAGSDLAQSDGLVTAEKILGLRLRGTDLVVLSACETGLGDVKNGEGVFGLRRAFTQAGAKSLVMSMWAVPDRETQELMVAFYTNMLSGKMNRAQALRQAALSQMQVVKARHGAAHPFFWGAFVFLGEP
jgi:CHAT domain-containing protein